MPNLRPRAAVKLALSLCCGGTLAQTAIPRSPANFVAIAFHSDQYETLVAKVALIQAQDPGIRGFAETMLHDHARTAETLRQAAVKAGLSGDEAALLSALQGARGHAFDRAYTRQHVVAHAATVAVDESFADAGATPSCEPQRRLACRSSQITSWRPVSS